MPSYSGNSKRAIVIGAGLGGLSCAIRLASAGYQVTVVEKQQTVGGKLQHVQMGEYSFDRGPSTITMLDLFERVFTAAGRKMSDYLSLYPLDPLTRNRFADGHVVDLRSDPLAVESQIAAYSPEDARQYRPFLLEAQRLYALSRGRFLDRLLLSPRDKLSWPIATGFAQIRPLTGLDKLLRRYFRHPNTLAMFGRYATYVGSSPYEAPAVFAMLAHVEASVGIYGIRGGTYNIPQAFAQLARELGVEIKLGTEVRRILVRDGQATGVETDTGTLEADVIICGADVLTAYRDLIDANDRRSMPDRRIARYEPSLSGFVVLAGVRRRFDQLLHHTVFFPDIYRDEFKDIFSRKRPPVDPTIYICWSGHSESNMAPEGCSNLFILANAPYQSDQTNWQVEAMPFAKKVLQRLDEAGLSGIESTIENRVLYTPSDLERDTGAYRGAIYGISSNSVGQTFARPSNRSRDVRGLWFVGGTTHPGGGTPIVTLSGQLVAEEIIRTAD